MKKRIHPRHANSDFSTDRQIPTPLSPAPPGGDDVSTVRPYTRGSSLPRDDNPKGPLSTAQYEVVRRWTKARLSVVIHDVCPTIRRTKAPPRCERSGGWLAGWLAAAAGLGTLSALRNATIVTTTIATCIPTIDAAYLLTQLDAPLILAASFLAPNLNFKSPHGSENSRLKKKPTH